MTPAQAIADLYRVVSFEALEDPEQYHGIEADFETLFNVLDTLEWYADQGHHDPPYQDKGKRARKALGEKP